MNRTLKNLYANYRYFGWRVFENQYELNMGNITSERDDIVSEILTDNVRKYELLKQIMMER